MSPTQNPEPGDRREAELLRSLGWLARGLSALFWGLPVTLIICAETARASWLKPLGMLPALFGTGLLLYGLWQMGRFQPQERPWRNALDRAQLSGLVNFGLCPFLYWQNKMPSQPFFNWAVFGLVLSAIIFLFHLNVVLKQLGAMLPDETLRQETRQFTMLNRWLLVALLLCATAYAFALNHPVVASKLGDFFVWINRFSFWALVFFALLPLAMTMALIWKTKEVILDSVFGARQ